MRSRDAPLLRLACGSFYILPGISHEGSARRRNLDLVRLVTCCRCSDEAGVCDDIAEDGSYNTWTYFEMSACPVWTTEQICGVDLAECLAELPR